MSGLIDQIQADLKAAMKAKATAELSALRMLKSDLQYEMTKTGVQTLTDEEVQAAVKRAIKKRKESIEQFQKAGRTEQAEAEQAEAKVLERYLPAEVAQEAIEKALAEIIAGIGTVGPGDMGKVMGQLMARFKGQNIDGGKVRVLVQERLQS